MKRKIRLSESEFANLIRKVLVQQTLNEQVVQGKGNDPYEYKKEGDKYYTRRKGSTTWIQTKDKVADAIATKIFKTTVTPTKTTTPDQNPTLNVPFKNSTEGNRFREWVNDTYPQYAKSISLDRKGSHTNSYILKAWDKYGKEYSSKKDTKGKISVMSGINPEYLKQVDWKKLSTNDSTNNVCRADTTECAQFLNNWDDRISSVGNAWTAYRNDTVMGPTVYSSFKGLDPTTVKNVISLWQDINKNGGGKQNGPYLSKVKNIVDKLVPKMGTYPNLKPGDYVGIFYPDSTHHEEAFYQGGEAWFVDGKPGKNIKSGNGWGMNTHIGIVAAVKDGIPLVFHNISGNVISDPASKLRIAWVKRPT